MTRSRMCLTLLAFSVCAFWFAGCNKPPSDVRLRINPDELPGRDLSLIKKVTMTHLTDAPGARLIITVPREMPGGKATLPDGKVTELRSSTFNDTLSLQVSSDDAKIIAEGGRVVLGFDEQTNKTFDVTVTNPARR